MEKERDPDVLIIATMMTVATAAYFKGEISRDELDTTLAMYMEDGKTTDDWLAGIDKSIAGLKLYLREGKLPA